MTQPAHQSILKDEVLLRLPGQVDYLPTFRAMQHFTSTRTPDTPDEIWLLEHAPVFTMGLKGRFGTLTHIHDIPVVYTDRGGDMTYHGPGQVVVYVLMDMTRRGWGAKHLVTALEQAVINLLAAHRISAERRAGAPGVYTGEAKIASLGLRVRQGASYHGLAFNVDMDLTPFSYIAPCGYPGQPVTQLVDLGVFLNSATASRNLLEELIRELGYTVQTRASNHLPFGPT